MDPKLGRDQRGSGKIRHRPHSIAPTRNRRPVGKCPALVAPCAGCAGVSVFNKHGRPAGTIGDFAARNAELPRRLAAMESSASSTPNPQQILLPSVIGMKLFKATSHVRWRQSGVGHLSVHVQNLRQCTQHVHGRPNGSCGECNKTVDTAYSAK